MDCSNVFGWRVLASFATDVNPFLARERASGSDWFDCDACAFSGELGFYFLQLRRS
jgi:hypothetical protein